MKNRLRQIILNGYERIILPLSAILTALLTFGNFYYVVIIFSRPLTAKEGKERIAFIVLSLLFVATSYWAIRFSYYSRASRILANARRQLFFHGYSVEQLIETRALSRLQDWIGSRMCYELSILAMLQCKDFKSAKICRGSRTIEDYDTIARHSWVEVTIPWNGQFVIDFAWDTGQLRSKRCFLKHIVGSDTLKKEWECTYADFWKLEYTNRLFDAVSRSETSHVLNCLASYGQPSHGYDFYGEVFDPDFPVIEQKQMTPQTRVGSNRPITDEIISAFVEQPEIIAPNYKTVRLARHQLQKHTYDALYKPS